MTKFLARYIWVAAAVPFGCASPNTAPNATEKDVLPFELRIDGKSAVFTPATADSYLIGRLPAAHIDGAVAVDAPIEVHVDPSAGVVRQVFARFIEVDDGGKQISREETLNFPRGATQAKLEKLRGPAKYGMIVTVTMEGTAKGGHVRVRFETRQKG